MTDILLAAAAGPGDLRAALRAGRRGGTGPCRVAVLDPTPQRIEQALALIDRGEPWQGGNDLWFAPRPAPPGGTVFLFPGLDARTGPPPDDVLRWLGRPAGPASGSTGLAERTRATLRLNRVLHAALLRAGIVPDAMAGHSAGEWSALFAAGLFAEPAFEDFARTMGAAPVPDVVFAAVGLPAEAAARLARDEPGVVLSHDNAPDQSVLCGDEDAVGRCLARIADPEVPRRVLPFRSGFHSPMLAPYLPGFSAVFDRVPLARPSVPVWSATTVAPYPDDETELRALLNRHLVEPVRFRAVIERLYRAGARVFVQVGCGSLTRFVAATLAGRPHRTVSAGSATRPQLDQLRWAAAALWAEGHAPDLPALGLTTPAAAPPPSSGPAPGIGPALSTGPAPSTHPVAGAYEAAVAAVSASVETVYRTWRERT
ncbi:acyltransferase domain-containing protein [Streptomyces tricolor]|uniref:Acyltransferase domain-containing protein n=1 Tax=Streptomyces tricolor TaxID=68277 RepID=A0ABS9JD01_9ACTN|nr:acyltransferase domain-containing protein [Streptomyces tricolor]MCG0063424.1 acyltransferase domain-containing protein [Streptomyces tricolor]